MPTANEPRVMECGHAANGTFDAGDGTGPQECCAICSLGGDPRARVRSLRPPDLAGRRSRCVYGDHDNRASSWALPFFEYRPGQPVDAHYCGCYGWD